jgi:uncharacterized protein (TIGR02996 family)
MSADGPFLRAIAAEPAEDAPRVVFADWLEERGQARRAEFIRVQCELSRTFADAGRRWELLERSRELERANAADWLGEAAAWADRVRWERGFPVVTMNAGTFLAASAEPGAFEAFERAGLMHLRLVGARGQVPAVAESPLLRHLHTLDLDGNRIGDASLDALLAGRQLASLHTLVVPNNVISDAGLAHLAAAGPRSLRFVDLRNNRIDAVTGRWPPPFAVDLDGNEVEGVGDPPPGVVVNSVGMRFVPVPAGRFWMGRGDGDLERDDDPARPQHPVTITRPFHIGAFAVTQGQWSAVTDESLDTPEDPFRPATGVTWDEVVEFCRRLAERPAEAIDGRVYRLPTEAEWEYACRADTRTRYWCGEVLTADDAHFAAAWTARVGSYPPNPWGLFETHGNVLEWCADWFGPYKRGDRPETDPTGPPEGTTRVLRGGSLEFDGEESCGSADRYEGVPSDSDFDIGFRVVMEANGRR